MLFNSFHFLIFFVITVITFFALPFRFRWVLLLFASYYFYMCWKAEYVVLILISTCINYFTGKLLEQNENQQLRKRILFVNICINLGILFSFKYANFFGSNVNLFLQRFSITGSLPHLQLLLPVGISFYTFQAMGYVIDVYQRKIKAEKHLGIFAVYVAFFPQLVAGPIERSYNLLPQFKEKTFITKDRIQSGFELILWGLFKKVVIADLIATMVNSVYSDPSAYSGPILIMSTFFFAIQIYCDFSGYSDIAIGTAKIFGYNLMKNFRQPYFSQSIAEFWKRWHISLSTWFRDYLYIPLGGNRVSQLRWVYNILVVFILSGLWHGAKWTLLIWGAYHGILLLLVHVCRPVSQIITNTLRLSNESRFYFIIKTLFVFSLVTFGWIFFRAESVSDAWYIITHLTSWKGFQIYDLFTLGLPRFEIALACIAVVILFAIDSLVFSANPWVLKMMENQRVKIALYCACIYSIIFFGVFEQIAFIYFQF